MTNDPSIPLPVVTVVENPSPQNKDHVPVGLGLNNAFLLQLTVVNSGTNEMGYFQLNVKDENGNELFLVTKRSLKQEGVTYLLQRASPSNWVPINVPDEIYGSFNGHSYTEWNIVVSSQEKRPKKLTAQIAITKKKWYKPFSQPYKGYTAIYDLSSPSIVRKNNENYSQQKENDSKN